MKSMIPHWHKDCFLLNRYVYERYLQYLFFQQFQDEQNQDDHRRNRKNGYHYSDQG